MHVMQSDIADCVLPKYFLRLIRQVHKQKKGNSWLFQTMCYISKVAMDMHKWCNYSSCYAILVLGKNWVDNFSSNNTTELCLHWMHRNLRTMLRILVRTSCGTAWSASSALILCLMQPRPMFLNLRAVDVYLSRKSGLRSCEKDQPMVKFYSVAKLYCIFSVSLTMIILSHEIVVVKTPANQSHQSNPRISDQKFECFCCCLQKIQKWLLSHYFLKERVFIKVNSKSHL